MKFNVAKCHSMRVTRHLPSNQIHFKYSLHQQTLEQVQSANYLGITITDNLEWELHLGIRRKLHTKHWLALSSSIQLLSGIPIMTLRQKRWRKCRRQQPGGSAGDGILDDLEWPSLEHRRLKSSLTFFYKIHSGTVSLHKDK